MLSISNWAAGTLPCSQFIHPFLSPFAGIPRHQTSQFSIHGWLFSGNHRGCWKGSKNAHLADFPLGKTKISKAWLTYCEHTELPMSRAASMPRFKPHRMQRPRSLLCTTMPWLPNDALAIASSTPGHAWDSKMTMQKLNCKRNAYSDCTTMKAPF